MVVSYYKHPGEVLYRQKETYTRDSLTFKQARAKYIWISESLFFSNDDSVPVAAPYSSCRFLLICKYLLVVWRECKRNFFVKATPFARDGQFFKKPKYAVWVTGRIWGAHIDPNPIPPPLFSPLAGQVFRDAGLIGSLSPRSALQMFRDEGIRSTVVLVRQIAAPRIFQKYDLRKRKQQQQQQQQHCAACLFSPFGPSLFGERRTTRQCSVAHFSSAFLVSAILFCLFLKKRKLIFPFHYLSACLSILNQFYSTLP